MAALGRGVGGGGALKPNAPNQVLGENPNVPVCGLSPGRQVVALQHVLRLLLLLRRVDGGRLAVAALVAGAVGGAAVTRADGEGVEAGPGRGADEGGLGVTGEQAPAVLDAGQLLSKQRLHLQHTTGPAEALI